MRSFTKGAILALAFLASVPAMADPVFRCEVKKRSDYTDPKILRVFHHFNSGQRYHGNGWVSVVCNSNCEVMTFAQKGFKVTPNLYYAAQEEAGTANHIDKYDVSIDRETGRFLWTKSAVLMKDGSLTGKTTKEGVCRKDKLKVVL